LKKASSVLLETAGTVDDFLKTPAVSHQPGDLVACSIGNKVCVVSSKTTETNLGREFLLELASPEQTETFKAQTAAKVVATKVWLDDTAKEQFDAGCAGMGPVGIGCQSWMAIGGVDPITGMEATPAQRALYGAQAVLNATGLVGLTAGVGGVAQATVNTPLKLGETKVIDSVSMTRVGRWMSPDELAQMQSTNKVVQGGGGQKFISTNGIADFKGAAPKGSVYVEFDVPANSLLQGGKDGWFKMIGPDAGKSQQFLLNKQGGEHLPAIKNIEIQGEK
jgi:filamentous hemagglutinin